MPFFRVPLLIRERPSFSSNGSILGSSLVRFMAPFVRAMHRMVAGEVIQLTHRGSIETTTEDYFGIIEGKTASLFRWAAEAGALAAGAGDDIADRLGRFGWHVGISFQMMDDILDLTADPLVLGKGLLSDIGEGKMTLPVILAAKRSAELRKMLVRLTAGDSSSTAGGIRPASRMALAS